MRGDYVITNFLQIISMYVVDVEFDFIIEA